MREIVHSAVLAFATLGLGTCSTPDFASGVIECGPGGSCPGGFECGADNLCYDQAPGSSDGSIADAGSSADGGSDYDASPPGNAPAGTILPYNRGACPAGWSRYAPAEGRTIVGTPAGGTGELTVGDAMADEGQLVVTVVPEHSHTATATSTLQSDTHTHTLDTIQTHDVDGTLGSTTSVQEVSQANGTTSSNDVTGHSHKVAIPSFTSGTAGPEKTHATMPYVQLLFCQREAG